LNYGYLLVGSTSSSLIIIGFILYSLFIFFSSLAVYAVTDTHDSSRWITGAEMRIPRSEVAGALLNENIYIIGGFKMNNETNYPSKTETVEIYDTKNNTWTYAAQLPLRMDHVAADSHNGKLYVVGGSTGSQNTKTNKLFIYDPGLNIWREGKSMPTARAALTANFVDGLMYAVGGQNSSNLPVSTNEAYDPSTDSWTTRASMPTARHHTASAVVDGELYVIGGRITERLSTVPFQNLDSNEKYDPRTNTWSQLEPMPSKRSGLGAASINGNIYAFGGQAPLRVYDNNEKYNPKADEWTLQSPMPTPRHGLASVPDTIKNNIYVIGGGTNSTDSVSATNEIFWPEK
jgi:N-acetylneuraminic acid mutarotase